MYDEIYGLDTHAEPQPVIDPPDPSQVDWEAAARKMIPAKGEKRKHTNSGLNRTL